MNKKAQGLSITTVVVAILAILVLVVLFYVFTTQMGKSTGELNKCPGSCVDTDANCISNNGVVLGRGSNVRYSKCVGSVPFCCSI